MCLITHYCDFHCGHRWASITAPCYPGMGFDTCPEFLNGQVQPLPPRLVAQGEKCPKWYVVIIITICLRFAIFLVAT